MPRNYPQEYARESPQRKKNRAKRNKARRQLIREGKAKVGDGKVAHHKKALSKGGSTARSNVAVQSKKASNSEGGKRQPKSGKARGGRH
jgi:hypothetical protein